MNLKSSRYHFIIKLKTYLILPSDFEPNWVNVVGVMCKLPAPHNPPQTPGSAPKWSLTIKYTKINSFITIFKKLTGVYIVDSNWILNPPPNFQLDFLPQNFQGAAKTRRRRGGFFFPANPIFFPTNLILFNCQLYTPLKTSIQIRSLALRQRWFSWLLICELKYPGVNKVLFI